MFKRSLTVVAVVAFLVLPQLVAAMMAADAGVLTCPRKLFAGSLGSATISVFDSITRAPVDREVLLWLLSSDRSEKIALASGRTGGTGVLNAQFDIPAGRSGAHFLTAEVAGLSEVLEVSTTLAQGQAILIETDKPIYKPGQKIQGRVILLNNQLKPAAGPVEVTFHDAKGIRLARFSLTADQYGVAPFSLDLASELNYGTWKIKAKTSSSESLKDVRVEQYVLPRFDLKLELPKSWALVDEPIQGMIEANYFFGKPVQGTAQLVAKRWVGVWQQYATASGDLVNGALSFHLPAVEFVTGTPTNGGQGAVILELSVEDSTGYKQTLSETVAITQAPVVLTILPSRNSIKPGVQLPVVIRAEAPDGQPQDAAIRVTIHYLAATTSTLKEESVNLEADEGAALLNLVAPEGTAVAHIRAETSAAGHSTTTETEIGAGYSPTGRFLSLTRLGSGPAAVGQPVTITVAGAPGATVYYEVYAGGRTLLSRATRGDMFSFVVTPDMAPKARVIGYSIADNNEVAADSLDFDVSLALSATVSAAFDKGEIKPGDPVKLTIDSGLGRRALLGVSLVDESVLALGRSRLRMAEVFAALEKEFMAPQAEVHEGEGGGPGAPMPFSPIRSEGALDILNNAGLAIDATTGILVPTGQDVWGWFGGAVPPEAPVSPPELANGGQAPPEAPRVRQFFPETWEWRPTLLTDESGKITLDLVAPDSITSWKLAVVATSPGGAADEAGIGIGEGGVTVFQDFFIEPSLPYSVTRGETFKIKIDVFNYLDTAQTVQLSFDGADGLVLLSPAELSLTAPANGATTAYFDVQPSEIGDLEFTVTGIGQTHSDAVLRQLKVVAEGVPVEQVENGVLAAGQTIPLEVSPPLGAVPDSYKATLYLTPSPVGQTMEGVSDLLGMPFGCGEQNMIFLAPDIEILRYLNEIDELAPEIRAKAEYYINVGYQRELTYQTDDGGFAAFGGENGSLWLTAFVLSTFSAARDVRDIDESVLGKAADMLKERQLPDGSFETDDFLIHQEMDGGQSNLYSLTAYTANALADYSVSESASALAQAAAYLQASYTEVDKDPYSLAIAAVTLQKIPGYATFSEQIIDRLLELAQTDGAGIHWEPYPVETTAYAALALMNAQGGAGRPEAAAAVDWLSTQRNSLGGYGQSTQDTVTALRALFLAARKVHRGVDLDVSVLAGETPIFTAHVDQSNFDLLQQFTLPTSAPNLSLRAQGAGSVAYQVANRFNLPISLVPPGHDLDLEVTYLVDHVETDEMVDVDVSITYRGAKEKTGMVILDVGVPTGFDAVNGSLDALVTAGKVARAEVAGRKVIFYIENLVRDVALEFRFQVRALYPVRMTPTTVKAYEYYDSKVSVVGRSGGLRPDGGQRESGRRRAR